MRLKAVFAAAVTAVLLAATTAAHAANLVYDTLTVYNGSGGVIASIQATPAEIKLDPTEFYYIGGVGVDLTQYGNYGVVLAGGTPVDVFGIATGGPDAYDLAFAPGAQASAYALQNAVQDTGAPINLTQDLAPSLRAAGDTAWFTASGDFTLGVPEPATWAMLILGVAMIGVTARRRGQELTLAAA